MFSEKERSFRALRVLDREKAKIRAKPVIEQAVPLLKELVDNGCATYDLCLEITHREYLHKPALALYRHVLEMTDAIQILIEHSCVDPVIPLSRSALEAAYSLKYLCQKDYEDRSLVWRYYRLRKNLQQYDPEEQDNDVREHFNELGPQEKAELKGLRERVKSDQYKDIHDRRKASSVPNYWFQWVQDGDKNGPAHLRALAEKLDQLIIYKTVYKAYSRVAHGDSHHYRDELRYPENIEDYAHRAAVLMKYAIGVMTIKFMGLKIDDYRVWDKRMQDRIDQLIKSRVDFTSHRDDRSR